MNESNPALFSGKIPNDGDLIVEIYKSDWGFGIGFRIGVKFPDGRMAVAEPLRFREYVPGMEALPFLTLMEPDASKIAGALSRAGIRLPGQESVDAQSNRISDLKDRVEDLKADKDRLLVAVLKIVEGGSSQ